MKDSRIVVQAEILQVDKFGSYQICTLKFMPSVIPFLGMELKGRFEHIITGIVIFKEMAKGIVLHPKENCEYDCKFELVIGSIADLES